MFAQFRIGRRNLLWSGVFLILLVKEILASANTLDSAPEAQDDGLDEKIVQDLKNYQRRFYAIGMTKSRFLVLVSDIPTSGFHDADPTTTTRAQDDWSTTTIHSKSAAKIAPNDYFVYDMTPSAFTPAGKLYLHGGVLIKEKWHGLYDWLVISENQWKQDWQYDYVHMFATDEQHEYFVTLQNISNSRFVDDFNNVYSFLIDRSAKVDEQMKHMSKGWVMDRNLVKICSMNEPMNFYFKNEQSYSVSTSYLGAGLEVAKDLVIAKQVFSGSTSLPEISGVKDVGKRYAICKSGESEIVTQEQSAHSCSESVDWDIRLGFVDNADRMVLFDKHMTMRSFPLSVLTPDGVGKPVKVETKKVGEYLESGLPPTPPPESSTVKGSSTGLIIGIIVVLLIVAIAAVVAVYCLCFQDRMASDNKKGSATPGKGLKKKGSSLSKNGKSSGKLSGKVSSKGSVKGPIKGPSKGSVMGTSKGLRKGPSKGTSNGPSKGPSKGSSKDSVKRFSRGQSKASSMMKASSKGKASSKRLTK